MHIPPPGPQRMRCNSLIFGWTLILVGLLLFPIGGFLLMAGGVALLAYAHKLKRLISDTETAQASPAADSVVNSIAVQQPVPARAPSALDKPFGDTFPISVWIDDAPFVDNGRVRQQNDQCSISLGHRVRERGDLAGCVKEFRDDARLPRAAFDAERAGG